MKRAWFRILPVVVLLAVFWHSGAAAQDYGKNKVEYRNFQWSMMSSTHFDVYFYDGAESLAYFAVEVAERASVMLGNDLGHTLTKRVPVIIYASHNDFEQTNVIPDLIDEGVGGFTEAFKNRVVVPFTGSYEDFRHVLVHELTHAYVFDALYGDMLESWLSGQYFFQLPLWFAEGLAEYESLGWDKEAEMFMRDATISGYVIPIDMIGGGYLAYKEGQSAVKFLVDRNGREKLAEIISLARGMKSLDKVFERSIGMTVSKFGEEWMKYLRKEYWPEVAGREDPEKFGRMITDHRKDNSYLNADPVISPDGERVALISDRKQFTNVLLISAIDGKLLASLVRGERNSQFESVPLFKRSLAWSPDGKTLAVIAKSKGREVIHLVDGTHGKVTASLRPDLDGIFSPSWSPDGEKLVISGLKNGKTDLYILDIVSGGLTRLTNDVYDDMDAVWMPDGKTILFSSDRGSPVLASEIMNGKERLKRYSIFSIDADGGEIRDVLFHEGGAVSLALSPDGKKLAFISLDGGTRNVFLYDMDSSSVSQITNVLGGVFSVSWSHENDRMALGIFKDGGWDVFITQEPDSMKMVLAKGVESAVADTAAMSRKMAQRSVVLLPLSEKIGKALSEKDGKAYAQAAGEDTAYVDGPKPYKFKLTADGITGGFQYSSAVGFGGSSELSFSDMFGNHKIYVATDIFSSIDQTNVMFVYYYLAKRLNLGFGGFHYKDYYYSNITLLGEQFSRARFFSERTYGYLLLASYPFDRFTRMDLDLTNLTIEREFFPDILPATGPLLPNARETIRMTAPTLSYVKDTSLWGNLGPTNGSRWWIAYSNSVKLSTSYRSFRKVSFDMRKYVGFGRGYSLAMRFGGSVGGGAQPETLLVGGVYTVRGYSDFAFRGTRAAFTNIELRYPFISQIGMVWPLPLSIRNIRGAAFFDAGSAWSDDGQFRLFKSSPDGRRLDSLKAAFGTGLHTSLSFLVLKFDTAWPTDLRSVGKPHYHFSLGAEF